MALRYVDLENGNDANDGTTFALRKKTIASACSGLVSTQDNTIRVMASLPAGAVGQDATWTNGSDTVTLASAVTAAIDDGEAAWTASANVTATASTSTYREGTKSASLAIGSAFTTGLAAYKSFAAKDLSGYQQVSFWVRVSAAVAASVLELRLCSDAAGAVAVDTFVLPAMTQNYWHQITIDKGAALGAAIQSVALHCASDPATVTVFFDNIIACKAASSADSLTLRSLISKGGADEPWFGIESIVGTTVKLGTGAYSVAAKGTLATKYWGSTETVALHKREAITTATQTVSVGGGSGGFTFSIECGWNRTDMSTQDGTTWIRPESNNAGSGVNVSTINGTYVNKLYVAHFFNSSSAGLTFFQGTRHAAGEFGAAQCYSAIQFSQVDDGCVDDGRWTMGCYRGIALTSSGGGHENNFTLKKLWGCSTSDTSCRGIAEESTYGTRLNLFIDEIKNVSLPFGTGAPGPVQVKCWGTTFAGNGNDPGDGGYAPATMFFHDCSFDASPSPGQKSRCFCTKFNKTEGDHRIYWDDPGSPPSSIVTATDQRHTASDFSWKFEPRSTSAVYARNPLHMSVAQVACNANEARTVKLWARRSNTGLTLRLVCKGRQIAGVNTDAVAAMTAAADTWEELSITFTPTEKGVVDIRAEAWGGDSYAGWIDDLTVT